MMNLQRTYTFPVTFQKIDALKQKEFAVTQNREMTAHERRQAAETLKAQRAALLPQVVNSLRLDWSEVKAQYIELRREKIAAADRSAKRWDYARLDFETKTAEKFIAKASPAEIAKRYEQIELSGDQHALRGFVDAGLLTLNARQFQPEDSGKASDLLQEFSKMQADLTTTKEQRELAKQGEILTDKIHDIYKATKAAANIYAANFEPTRDINGDYVDFQPDPFAEMTQGVDGRLREWVDPKTLTTHRDANPNWE